MLKFRNNTNAVGGVSLTTILLSLFFVAIILGVLGLVSISAILLGIFLIILPVVMGIYGFKMLMGGHQVAGFIVLALAITILVFAWVVGGALILLGLLSL
jgi:hypothetical protein